MKSLKEIILEYKGHAIRDKEKSIGDPDEIKHYFAQGWTHLKFNKDNAYPYVYNIKLDKIIFGDANTIHNSIFTSKNEKMLKEMGLQDVKAIGQIRYCCGVDDDTEEIDKWYEKNKQYIDNTICGRIWYNAQDDFETWDLDQQEQMAAIFDELKELDSSKCYIANWNEVSPNEFQKINDNIVKHFCKTHNVKIDSYIAIDNNGEPKELFVGENAKSEKRSDTAKQRIEKEYELHTGTSEEARKMKREKTEPFRKNRDEKNQQVYNHTRSKTEAEYRSLKYQENMKSIQDIIDEGFSSPDVFYIKNGPSINWGRRNAYPFFYNTKTNKAYIGSESENHYTTFKFIKPTDAKEIFPNLDFSDKSQMSDNWDKVLDACDDGVNSEIKRGRLWILPSKKLKAYVYNENVDEARSTDEIHIKDTDVKENPDTVFIAFWDKLEDNKTKQICKTVIDKMNDEVYGNYLTINEYYFIDANGDWEIFDTNKNDELSTANVKSDDETRQRELIKSIHLASQKEKKDFYAEFKKNRDEKNQQIYNHTKSKTEAEYRSLKYQESKMKTIMNYILESTPDAIDFNNVHHIWYDKNAYGFLYNSKTDTSLIANPGVTHSDMVDALSTPGNDEINNAFINIKQSKDFRMCAYEDWDELRPSRRGKQKTDYILGRLWNLRKSKTIEAPTILIAFWQELNSEDMHKSVLSTVNEFVKLKTRKSLDNYNIYAVDNNGELYEFKHNEVKQIEKRSEDSKKQLGIARAIHLATQEEKKDFYAAFKKTRDEKNQKIYNHTKSKTEAEWRSLRYQENLKSIQDIIAEHKYELGNLIFELDEDSKEMLSDEFKQILETNNNTISIDMILEMSEQAARFKHKGHDNHKQRGNRTVWTSNDGDELKIGNHATEREDRPEEKGGDGEHIDEEEIINMFKYTWDDLIDLYNDGALDAFEYKDRLVEAWVTEQHCYLVEDDEGLVEDGARKDSQTLWSVWMVKEQNGYKLDVIIRTIFRGGFLKHGKPQERIKIDQRGAIKVKDRRNFNWH